MVHDSTVIALCALLLVRIHRSFVAKNLLLSSLGIFHSHIDCIVVAQLSGMCLITLQEKIGSNRRANITALEPSMGMDSFTVPVGCNNNMLDVSASPYSFPRSKPWKASKVCKGLSVHRTDHYPRCAKPRIGPDDNCRCGLETLDREWTIFKHCITTDHAS